MNTDAKGVYWKKLLTSMHNFLQYSIALLWTAAIQLRSNATKNAIGTQMYCDIILHFCLP